jgi:hypothetical protein
MQLDDDCLFVTAGHPSGERSLTACEKAHPDELLEGHEVHRAELPGYQLE